MDEACRLRRDEGYGACEDEALLFAYFFWQDRWNQIANQRSVCNLERTSNGTDETCRLRRGEECGVCEDEPPEAQLRCRRINGSPVNTGQTAPTEVKQGTVHITGGMAASSPQG